MSRHLIFIAYALGSGPGGPEAHVNLRLLQAMAKHWPGTVTVISGASPAFSDAFRAANPVDGWAFHSLGETGTDGAGAQSHPLFCRLADTNRASAPNGERPPPSLLVRLVNRYVSWAYGCSLRLKSWETMAARVVRDAVAAHPDAVIYSRALPFASIAAAAPVVRTWRGPWIVNINDPLPPDVWPGLYPANLHSCRRMKAALRHCLPRINAVTFPCSRLRDLECNAFPELRALPQRLLPHVGCSLSPGPAGERCDSGTPALRIAFAGTLRKTRIAPAFQQALAAVASAHPEVTRAVRLSFHLARPTPFAEAFIATLPVPTEVAYGEFDAALDTALARADVLLDLEAEADRPLLLTKVANAVGLGRPLWAVCATGGTTWELVTRHGWGYASDLNTAASQADTLLRMHGDWRDGRLTAKAPSPALCGRFSGERVVADLAELCEILTSDAAPPARQAPPDDGP